MSFSSERAAVGPSFSCRTAPLSSWEERRALALHAPEAATGERRVILTGFPLGIERASKSSPLMMRHGDFKVCLTLLIIAVADELRLLRPHRHPLKLLGGLFQVLGDCRVSCPSWRQQTKKQAFGESCPP